MLCFTDYGHPMNKSEILDRCGRQNMLRLYLKILDWDLIFGRAVKAISSPGVRSPCTCRWWFFPEYISILSMPSQHGPQHTSICTWLKGAKGSFTIYFGMYWE